MSATVWELLGRIFGGKRAKAVGAAVNSRVPAPKVPEGPTLLRRDWRGYVPVSAAKLAAALPEHARELAGAFVEAGEEYDLHPLFLAAISQHETAAWTSFAYRVKHNAMGVSDARGPIPFRSAAESVRRMAASLARPGGHYRNCRTLEDVWMVYSPPSFAQADGRPVSNDPHDYNRSWGPMVLRNWQSLSARVGMV